MRSGNSFRKPTSRDRKPCSPQARTHTTTTEASAKVRGRTEYYRYRPVTPLAKVSRSVISRFLTHRAHSTTARPNANRSNRTASRTAPGAPRFCGRLCTLATACTIARRLLLAFSLAMSSPLIGLRSIRRPADARGGRAVSTRAPAPRLESTVLRYAVGAGLNR